MKKLISLLLSAILLISLVACGSASAPAQGGSETTAASQGSGEFLVGYSKVNITCEYSVPLRGYGDTEKRMSNGFTDYIYATCAAITGTNGETVIVFGIDLTNAFTEPFTKFRNAVAKACDVPVENVHMSCSHMHSGCDMSLTKISTVNDYIRDCEKWFVEAAEEAMADRKPATISYATTYTENLNFVRRYYRSDGTPAGDNYGNFSDAPITEHESEVDNQLQLIKFSREEGKDIIMANFQMHPHRNGGSKNLNMTADIPGVFRTELENQLGVNVLYFTGASGNVNPTSRITEENITKDYIEQGKALAKYAIDLEGKYTEIPVGPVHNLTQEFTGQTDHSMDSKLMAANYMQQQLDSGKTFEELKDYAKENGINSKYSPNCIIRKASAPDTRTTGVFAFSVADLGFAVVPFEMFDTNGKFVKDNSPFQATFVLTCANQHNTYLPSALGYQNGGYEVDQAHFAPGTGEVIADLYVEMLTNLHNR